MYNKLRVKERIELMKSYRKANKDMSYRDMVNDYNTSYEKFQDGGKSDGMTGLMKSKIATEAHYGNPAALRMVSPNPKTGMTPEGIGTHYMSSMDNYAVPLLQDKGNKNLEYIENPPISKEDIRFNSPEEAQYFAEHYKEVAPMMRNFQHHKYGGIQKFQDGGTKKPQTRTDVYTDKALFDKAYKAEMDSSNRYNEYINKVKQYKKEGLDLKKTSLVDKSTLDFMNDPIFANSIYSKPIKQEYYGNPTKSNNFTSQAVALVYKKPIVHNIYQPPLLPEPVKKDIIRQWNFNGPNPVMEYYDKSGKLINKEYYKDMNDFKKGKKIQVLDK